MNSKSDSSGSTESERLQNAARRTRRNLCHDSYCPNHDSDKPVVWYMASPMRLYMQRRLRFIYGQTAWMFTTFFALTLLGALSLELLFVISFIGLLVMTTLTAPFTLTPDWHQRLKWLILLALIVFGVIVIRRILAILPPGVL